MKVINRVFWVSIAIVFLLQAPALQAQGQSIAIVNPSFEDPPLDDGGLSNSAPGWLTTAGGGDGIYNPNITQLPAGAVPDGDNVAFNNGTDISQVLTEVLEANTAYRLQAQIGRRLDEPFPGYRLELWAGGAPLAGDSSASPAAGSFAASTVHYATGASHPHLGQNLEIHLISNGIQVNFDEVVLTKSCLPKVEIVWPSGDTGVRFAVVDPDAGALTQADFAAAAQGSFAVPVAPVSGFWIPTLPRAPKAKWIASQAGLGSGGVPESVLYDITFFNECTTTEAAQVTFLFGVDDQLGDSVNTAGLYINGLAGAIPGSDTFNTSPSIANFSRENVLGPLDITGLIQPGENHLTMYQRDLGGTGGIIFQAEIKFQCRSTMAGQPVIHQFGQVVAGDGSSSSFVVHNPHSNPLLVGLEFIDSGGALVTDQQTTIAPGGTEVIVLGPSGPLQSGWVEITAAAPFNATEFLDLDVGGTAVPRVGVLPCELTRKATFYAEDLAGRLSGLAVANPNVFGQANMTISLTDPAGIPSGPSLMLSLPHRNHLAQFLASDFNPVEGTVTVESDVPVCVLSLLQDAQGALTTVAVSTDRP